MCCAHWLALGVALACLLASGPVSAESKRVVKAERAMREGRYQEAIKIVEPAADYRVNYRAMMVMAELKLTVGDYDAAELWVKRALARAHSPDETARAVTFRGLVARKTGDYEAAKRSFARVAEEFPSYRPARLEYGALLLELGDKKAANPLLDRFADEYNEGKVTGAVDLTMVAIAVRLLEFYEDANDVLIEATELDPTYTPAFTAWGDLFWEKYNADDAEFAYKAALKQNPDYPPALLGLAKVKLGSSTDLDVARELIAHALRINKRNPDALVLLAQLQIEDERYQMALKTLRRALRTNPRHIEALTLMATCHYLLDDHKHFSRARKKVFRINPKAAGFYTTVARFAVRVHRYREAIDFNRQALRVDPDYWRAFVDLGIGYTRIGDDKRGFEYLLKGYHNDPFNVRAFNMVNLYEKTIPHYTFVERGPLRFRFHEKEAEVLSLVVPPLAQRALATFSKKYHFTPRGKISVEIFRSAESFSVRSVGLPNISPHGICFGNVVTARSPFEGGFNWAEVIWHELAHVYHIQLSNSRVPRWFTEGLAEYETGVERSEWRREHDLELVSALKQDRLLSVDDLSMGFTHANTVDDLMLAYYQSTLVIEFIVERWGFESIVRALKLYAASHRTSAVLRRITGLTVAGFDGAFVHWLRERYGQLLGTYEPFLGQFDQLPRFDRAAKDHPRSAKAQAELAAALLNRRKIDRAESTAKAALKLDPKQPLALFLLALYELRTRKAADALGHLQAMVEGGHDGYAIETHLAEAALALGDFEAAVLHNLRAVDLYPRGVVAHRNLAEIHLKAGDKAAAASDLREVVDLDQGDLAAAKRLMALEIELDNTKAAIAAGRQAVEINPFDAPLNVTLAGVALDAGDAVTAERSYLLAMAGRPGETGRARATLLIGLARARDANGDRTGAREALRRARTADPSHPELDATRDHLKSH